MDSASEVVLRVLTVFVPMTSTYHITPILFGPGFAVRLSDSEAIEDLSKVTPYRPYREICSLDGRSVNPGCNQGGD